MVPFFIGLNATGRLLILSGSGFVLSNSTQ
jgi:hypothetical protein